MTEVTAEVIVMHARVTDKSRAYETVECWHNREHRQT